MKRLALAIALIPALSGIAAAQDAGLPLTPPAGWVSVDTTAMAIPKTTVLFAWRDPATPAGQFAPNINVSYQTYDGTLQSFGDVSVAQVKADYPDATVETYAATAVCGQPAYRFAWSGLVVARTVLHFDQLVVKTAHGVEFATYSRENAKPANPDALAALETFCHPAEPAAS